MHACNGHHADIAVAVRAFDQEEIGHDILSFVKLMR